MPRPLRSVTAVVALFVALAAIGSATTSPSPTGAVLAATAPPASATSAPASETPVASVSARPSSPPPASDPPPASPLASATPPLAVAGPFAMNLYRRGDFASQATKEQCVSGAMQTMLNIVGDSQDRSTQTQAKLAVIARALSGTDGRSTEPAGWARGLSQLGAGRYVVAVEPTRDAAIRRAVVALRATGRPVGLLVWRGAHSWVLHGFAASADPALTTRFTIRTLFISDPWYPRISSIWGPSRGPNAAVSPNAMPEDYLPWRRPTGRYPGMDGKFVLVLPVAGE